MATLLGRDTSLDAATLKLRLADSARRDSHTAASPDARAWGRQARCLRTAVLEGCAWQARQHRYAAADSHAYRKRDLSTVADFESHASTDWHAPADGHLTPPNVGGFHLPNAQGCLLCHARFGARRHPSVSQRNLAPHVCGRASHDAWLRELPSRAHACTTRLAHAGRGICDWTSCRHARHTLYWLPTRG